MANNKKFSKVLLPIFLILVVYNNELLDPTQPLKTFLLSLFCFFTNIYVLIKSYLARREVLIHPIVMLCLLYLVIGLISLGYTKNPSQGYIEWVRMFLFFNFLILTATYLKKKADRFLYTISIFFTLFQFIAIASVLYNFYYQGFEIALFQTKFLGGMFVNSNQLSQLVLLSLPFSLYGGIIDADSNKVKRALFIISSILSIVLLLVLGSKVVLISLALMSVVCFGYILYAKTKGLNRRNKWVLAASIITILIGSSYAGFKLVDDITKSDSFGIRKELWSRTILSINDKPIEGQGLGSWSVTNLKYTPIDKTKGLDLSNNYIYSSSMKSSFIRPHNDFLWVWSEMGIFGFLSYVLLFGLAIKYGLLSIKTSSGKPRQFYLLIFSALLAFVLISLFSFPKERIEQIMLLSFIIGIIVYATSSDKSIKNTSKRKVYFIIAVFILLSAVTSYISYKRLVSESHYSKALEANANQNWAVVVEESQLAKSPYYSMGTDGIPVDWYTGLAYMNLAELDQAQQCFKLAHEVHPNHVHVLNNLATTEVMKGKVEEGKAIYLRALLINPNFEDARINLSGIYFNEGNLDSAYSNISKINHRTGNPQYRKFAQAILKKKYEAEFLEIAEQNAFKEEALVFLSSDPLRYFFLYEESINKKKSIQKAFTEKFDYLMD